MNMDSVSLFRISCSHTFRGNALIALSLLPLCDSHQAVPWLIQVEVMAEDSPGLGAHKGRPYGCVQDDDSPGFKTDHSPLEGESSEAEPQATDNLNAVGGLRES